MQCQILCRIPLRRPKTSYLKEKQMGRPVNKRNFGKGTGNQLKTKFKLGGTEYEGYIVSQRATRRFRVSSMNDAVTGICTLVDKTPGELDNGDMVVVVRLDNGTTGRATKIYNRVAIVNGNKVPWNFSTSTTDGAAQVADADATGLTPVISIGTQPQQNTSVIEPATATFTVVATATPTATLTYQWQVSEDEGDTWTNINSATSASYTTPATTVEADDGKEFRVIVSAVGAVSVTSDAATLTVTAE
jgi:hypothetical protein